MRLGAAIAGVVVAWAATCVQAAPAKPPVTPKPASASAHATHAPATSEKAKAATSATAEKANTGAAPGAASNSPVVAAPVVPPAPWPPPALDEMPERSPARAAVDRSWRLPAASAEERVERTRRVGLSYGISELDGPARGLVFLDREGDPIERARLATALAPSLPAAHAALARAELDAGDLPAAARALREALDAAPRHLEARAWLLATGANVATIAGVAFALWFALLAAASSLPALSYALGATRIKLGAPSTLAAAGAFVMACALVEGPAGVVLALTALGVASGTTAKRIAVAASAAIGLLALYVGLEQVALGRLMLVADPITVAVQRVENGLATPADAGLVLRTAASEREAASAAALQARRTGDLDLAAQWFARLLARHPEAADYVNAANVEFQRGDVKQAIALYQEAVRREPSAIGYYDLSQAYGRAIRLDDQDRALAHAQALDASAVSRLAGASGNGGDHAYVGDAALGAGEVAARVGASGTPAQLAALARARFAPGWLGRGSSVAAAIALAVLSAASLGGGALARAAGPRDFYADIARTLRTDVGDSTQRVAQLTKLRTRRARSERLLTAFALLVPGAAGFRFGRPFAALLATAACATAFAVTSALRDALPDPLAVGELPALLAHAALIGCAALYVLATAAAFVLRAED